MRTYKEIVKNYILIFNKIKRNGGFDFSKLLRKSKNDKQQF